MPPVGFEPTVSAGERPQNNALDRAVTGTGTHTQCAEQKTPSITNIFQPRNLKDEFRLSEIILLLPLPLPLPLPPPPPPPPPLPLLPPTLLLLLLLKSNGQFF